MNRVARRRAAKQVSGRQTAVTHRVAALLLGYPDEDLLALLPTVRDAVVELAAPLAEPLGRVVDHLTARPLRDLQAEYVETFDLRRRSALHLTYYAYGDTRKRGVALVEIKQAFRSVGLELTDGPAGPELPDHLAVLLELSSAGGGAQEVGLRILLDHRAGLELLRMSLVDAGSPWADVLVAVCATLPPLGGDEREAVRRLAAQGPPGEDVGLEPFGPATTMEDVMAGPGGPPLPAGSAIAPPSSSGPVPLPTPGVRR